MNVVLVEEPLLFPIVRLCFPSGQHFIKLETFRGPCGSVGVYFGSVIDAPQRILLLSSTFHPAPLLTLVERIRIVEADLRRHQQLIAGVTTLVGTDGEVARVNGFSSQGDLTACGISTPHKKLLLFGFGTVGSVPVVVSERTCEDLLIQIECCRWPTLLFSFPLREGKACFQVAFRKLLQLSDERSASPQSRCPQLITIVTDDHPLQQISIRRHLLPTGVLSVFVENDLIRRLALRDIRVHESIHDGRKRFTVVRPRIAARWYFSAQYQPWVEPKNSNVCHKLLEDKRFVPADEHSRLLQCAFVKVTFPLESGQHQDWLDHGESITLALHDSVRCIQCVSPANFLVTFGVLLGAAVNVSVSVLRDAKSAEEYIELLVSENENMAREGMSKSRLVVRESLKGKGKVFFVEEEEENTIQYWVWDSLYRCSTSVMKRAGYLFVAVFIGKSVNQNLIDPLMEWFGQSAVTFDGVPF